VRQQRARRFGAAPALTSVVLLFAGCGSSSSGLVSIGAGLQGPQGLRATVYARGLKLASAFALDSQGRLWVATSGATTHATDGVYVVPRPGAKPLKVISRIRGPLGLAWVGRTLYVSSLGRVEAFSGLRGTSFIRRETILDGPVPGGENNNLVLAPDGRLVMGVSASCDHCTPSSRYSGSIVSFRRDGSVLRVYAGRIRAAFGLVYRQGELYATMNQRDDLGKKTPGDWLAVVHEGESWGFPECYGQGGGVCEGVPKPTAVLDPHAAAGGVAFQGSSAIVAEWALGKVVRVDGSHVSTYLTGFRNPLPALAAGDALLVGDWGTGVVYRLLRTS
jgi:glucose/arabinose dehydrogenase